MGAQLYEVEAPLVSPEHQQRNLLRTLGIHTPDTLLESIQKDAKEPYLIEGLLRSGSVNLLVGDSGLGKTPLAIQTALCVAVGKDLFGRGVQPGPVLYCDAETGKREFYDTLFAISKFLGMREPPRNFHVWSPNWEPEPPDYQPWKNHGSRLPQVVKAVEPIFVVVDALRTFWPQAEGKNDQAAEMIASLRRFKETTWLLLHHRRNEHHHERKWRHQAA